MMSSWTDLSAEEQLRARLAQQQFIAKPILRMHHLAGSVGADLAPPVRAGLLPRQEHPARAVYGGDRASYVVGVASAGTDFSRLVAAVW
ncbi:MAG: hypothetical protein WCF33_15400 [Pseudonocardiaceae bacterium]